MPSRRIPPDQRKRTEMSCDKCKARKQKCHRPLTAAPSSSARAVPGAASASAAARDDPRAGLPCRYCQTHNHVCVTTQPRKKRGTYYAAGAAAPGDADAAARAALLEGLVRGLVPGADTATVAALRALGRALGIPLPEAAPDGTLADAADEDAPADADDDPAAAGAEELATGASDGLPGRPREAVFDAAGPENGLPDCAGQTQYVGANSSYAMQRRVRALLTGVDDGPTARFSLFAGAPAGGPSSPDEATMPWGGADDDADDGDDDDDDELLALHDAGAADALLAAYFAHVHPRFPVLDEAAFRAAYADCLGPGGGGVDPAWLCSVYCVFLLAQPFAPPERAPGRAAAWWRRVRGLLPAVLLASRPAAVAALLLAAAHLNHTNRRDACWTLTGAAARIAVAVGLPRPPPPAASPVDDDAGDATRHRQNPLDALWWALGRFERLQAASLDRPSALEAAAAAVPIPSSPERALSLLLARAARLAHAGPAPPPGSPPAPAVARLLRDLAHWRAALPPALRRPDAAATAPSSPRRRAAVLRLHVEHQHVLCVASRGALLRRCGDGAVPFSPRPSSGPPTEQQPHDLAAVAVRAARASLDLLLALAADGLDPYAGWDLYFLYQAVLVLGLHVASSAPRAADADADVVLLGRAAAVAARVEADARVPGTMRRYACVIREVDALVQQQVQPPPPPMPSAKRAHEEEEEEQEEVKWSVAACEATAPCGPGAAATLMPPPPSHDDVLGVMSQVSFPLAPPELAAPFGLGDGGFWLGPREGWGDFMGFGT